MEISSRIPLPEHAPAASPTIEIALSVAAAERVGLNVGDRLHALVDTTDPKIKHAYMIGTISPASDVDFYSFTVAANDVVTLGWERGDGVLLRDEAAL